MYQLLYRVIKLMSLSTGRRHSQTICESSAMLTEFLKAARVMVQLSTEGRGTERGRGYLRLIPGLCWVIKCIDRLIRNDGG